MIDIVSIKEAVKRKELRFYVKNGIIYCDADNGDCVKVGEVKGNEQANRAFRQGVHTERA